MTFRQTLLVGALLCCGLLLAGAVTAAPATSIDEPIDGSENATESTQVGICVVGVDSPCNGEQWDGDGHNGSVSETVERSSGGAGSSGADAGICVVGADSPCNGEQWDGDRPARTEESTAHGESGTVETETGFALPGWDLLVRLFGGFGLALF